MPPNAAASSSVLQRRPAFESSTRNTGILHEREEHVLERVALRRETAHLDAAANEERVDRSGRRGRVKPETDHAGGPIEDADPRHAGQDRRGLLYVVDLHADALGASAEVRRR